MTILDVFNEFPEPYRTQAIENSLPGNLKCKINNPAIRHMEAIGFGFSFLRSKEGVHYWIDFRNKLKEGKIKMTSQQTTHN